MVFCFCFLKSWVITSYLSMWEGGSYQVNPMLRPGGEGLFGHSGLLRKVSIGDHHHLSWFILGIEGSEMVQWAGSSMFSFTCDLECGLTANPTRACCPLVMKALEAGFMTTGTIFICLD